MKRDPRQQGQVIVLLLVAFSIVLIAAVGLAIDGSNLYAAHQLAQVAADASAQAAMMSVFNGTNNSDDSPAAWFDTTNFNCGVGDNRTPCSYAAQNGFPAGPADTITVEFPSPSLYPDVPLCGDDDINLVRVTITHAVETTLMRLLGPRATSIKASATAAIVSWSGAPPVLVTHPAKDKSFKIGKKASLVIHGGPRRSIQVNSGKKEAYECGDNAVVDLSLAGPFDSGGDFGVFGGPGKKKKNCNMLFGSAGHFIQPASPIEDPFALVPEPTKPKAAAKIAKLNPDDHGCPKSSPGCDLYSPGLYTSIDVNMAEVAVFKPGVYWMDKEGFKGRDTGTLVMSQGYADDPVTGQGMMVYLKGDAKLELTGASNSHLVGPPFGSVYKTILFFKDRSATKEMAHQLSTHGDLVLEGSVYLNNTLIAKKKDAKKTEYKGAQTLNLSKEGTEEGKVIDHGLLVVGALNIVDNADVVMYLDPDLAHGLHVRQVALIR